MSNNLYITLDEVSKKEYMRINLTSDECKQIINLYNIEKAHQKLNSELRIELDKIKRECEKYFSLYMIYKYKCENTDENFTINSYLLFCKKYKLNKNKLEHLQLFKKLIM